VRLQSRPQYVVAGYRTLPTATNVSLPNIYTGAQLPVHSWGNADVPAKRGALSELLKKAEAPAWFTASGAVLIYADKVNAMPVDTLSHALQQTPLYTITDGSARGFATHLKDVAGSSPGHYLVIGASGGLAGVAIGSFFYPNMSLAERVFWFVGGAVALVVIVALLAHFGVLSEKPAVR
jgi:hypothetical protein